MSDPSSPILVASDLSPRADRAMQRAFRIGAQQNRKVIVFSVLDDAMPTDIIEDTHARAKVRLERFAASLAEGRPFEVHTCIGDPSTDILRMIQETGAGLLVMGVPRPRAFLKALRETTMQRIVRNTACAALLVMDTCDHDYDKVLLACDFSPACSSALRLARDLAPGAVITALHALHIPYSGMLGRSDAARNDLELPFQQEAQALDAAWRRNSDLASDAGIGDTEILVGSPYPTIRERAENLPADLIAVGAHGRVGSAPAFLGSLANDLIRNPPCDILVCRP
jgi:nucleotide-binding universal stress UspA family protein